MQPEYADRQIPCFRIMHGSHNLVLKFTNYTAVSQPCRMQYASWRWGRAQTTGPGRRRAGLG